VVLLTGCVMSFFGIGVDPAVKVYTAESYPTSIRATGTSVTEGIGRLLSGVIGPALVPPLLVAGGVSTVYLLIGAVAVVAVVTVAVFGEETKGRTLEAITAPPSTARAAGDRHQPFQIVLRFVNSRMPAAASSRPKPECLIPPKGSSGYETVIPLTKTAPAPSAAMK
jgi:MFS family permease